jgi:hypothetical protein
MDDREAYLALLIEEFRSLASGGHQATRHTYTALQWGTAVVGLVVGAAISQWGKHDAAVELVFLLGVPALVAVGMLYWVGELARIRRMHEFMCVVEVKADMALEHEGSSESAGRWMESFKNEWLTQSAGIFAELQLPISGGRGDGAVASGPIAFERWLRGIRRSSGNDSLTWVFVVRFVLFPCAIVAAWVTGVYYVFFQSTERGLDCASSAAILVGFLIVVLANWLAGELIADLSKWPAESSSSDLSSPRQTFRQVIGYLFRIDDWKP